MQSCENRPRTCFYENKSRHGGNDCCFAPASVSMLSHVKCSKEPPPIIFDGVGQSSVVPNLNEPIVTNWPSKCSTNSEIPKKSKAQICDEAHNTIAKIPTTSVPLVTKVMQYPDGDSIKVEPLNDPMFPDAALTLTVSPPVKKPVEIRIPECKNIQIRPPQRSWTQCVEIPAINDSVRRPMARQCQERPIPPVVMSSNDFNRILMKMNESERKKSEKEALCAQKECEKLQSRYRHSIWNYTVESLLERKRKEEEQKIAASTAADQALVNELKAEKEKESLEARERANKLMLYRKGLIRDFHSSMAASKLIAENAASEGGCIQSSPPNLCNPPFLNRVCLRKMSWINDRPDYSTLLSNTKKEQPCSQELMDLLIKDEKRVRERESLLACEKKCAEELRREEPLPYSKAYLKHIAEKPTCAEQEEDAIDEAKMKKIEKQCNFYEDIQNRLRLDAYVESREKEQQRQADCYQNYFRERSRLIKEKEQQLIDEKVAMHIRASERAAEALKEAQARKAGREDEYNQLRQQWENDFNEKKIKKEQEKIEKMEKVYADFMKRKNEEICKQQILDAGREWNKVQKNASENYYNLECEIANIRKEEAEELQLYHKAQIADKKRREDQRKHLDCVFGWKAKKAFEDEEEEMREYAKKCIHEWEQKGRPIEPMLQAMKKWDYEGGMFPHPSNFKIPEECTQNQPRNAGSCDKRSNSYETTSNRLGFSGAGGT